MKLGVPAVVVASAQFDQLAKVILAAQKVPETVKIVIDRNPEYIPEPELDAMADWVLEEAVKRLTRVHAT